MPIYTKPFLLRTRRMGAGILCATLTVLSGPAMAQQQSKPAPRRTTAPTKAAKPAQKRRPQRQASPQKKADTMDLGKLVPSRPGGLTADQVASAAHKHAPSLEMKNAEIEAAAAKVDETMAQFFPRLTATASYTYLSKATLGFGSDEGGNLVGAANSGPLIVGPCPGGAPGSCVLDSAGSPAMASPLDFGVEDPPRNNFSLQASLSIPISDYIWSYRPAKLAVIAEREGYEVARRIEARKVRGDARTAYYNWLRALASVEVTKIAIGQLKARIKDAKTALAAGAISTLELRRLEALEAKTQAGLEAAHGFLSLSSQQLALIMGEDKAPTHPAPAAWNTAPEPALAQPVERQVDFALDHRLEFSSIKTGLKALRQGQRGARSFYYPRVDGVADFTYANPNQRFFPMTQEWNESWYVGVALTWMVHQIPKARAQIRGLAAKEKALMAQQSMLRRGLELEVRKAYLDAQTAHRSARALRRATLASQEAYRVATKRFKAGASTASELIDAQAELTQAQLQEINARIDIKVASLRLRMATGREL